MSVDLPMALTLFLPLGSIGRRGGEHGIFRLYTWHATLSIRYISVSSNIHLVIICTIGESHMQDLAEKYLIEHAFQLPMTQESAFAADHGRCVDLSLIL